ncbi:MAG: hypothetical protein HKO58_01755, partial [Gammaproteobacteria bacterium]|nr:hypothetical protein [Gammaproteobacteria bacterium]
CNALQHVIHNNIAISDEAAAMEYRQAGVIIVKGRTDNIKLTYPEDVPVLEKLLDQRFDRGELEFDE